jgi:PKD repeat protein
LIEAVPGDSVVSGSGAATIDTLPYDITISDPPLAVATPVALGASFVASNPGMAYTYDWHVSSSNGQVSDDGRGTAVVSDDEGTTSFQFTPTAAGAYTVTLSITNGYGGANQATLTETVGTVTPFTTQIGTGASEIPGSYRVPITLTATAAGTYPVATYAWAVTAPSSATTPQPGFSSSYTFTPTGAGEYLVTLTATDSNGDVSVSEVTVIVPCVTPSVQIFGVPANEYVGEGYAFSLASIISNPTSENDLTEAWTVTAGDSSQSPFTESGPSVTYTPDDIGTYAVTLELLDANRNVVASASQQLISIGVAPTATVSGGPQGGTTNEGVSLSFTGKARSPSTVTTARGFYYSWSVTLGPDTYVAPTTATTSITGPSSFSFTPGQAGTYVLSLSVTDYHGFTSVAATQSVTVTAVPPTVTITGLPSGSVTEGTTVALGSIVTNPSAVLQSAGFGEEWTVLLAGTAYGPFTGPALNLTLGSVGSYSVELTATDAEGDSSTTTTVITAADAAPVLTPSRSPAAQSPEQATLTEFDLGSVTGPGLENGPGFVSVNWGDGTAATSLQISSQGALGLQSYAYELSGRYVVTVTVTDIYGLSGSESFATTVIPVAPAPEIEGAPASLSAGSTVTLTSSVTDFSQVETAAAFAYAWSVELNGSPYTLPGSPSTSGPSLAFTPELDGTYTVSLATTDSSGSLGVAPAQTIVVDDVPPAAGAISAPSAISSGVAFSVSAQFTDPDPTVAHTAVWNWGDSTTTSRTVAEPSRSTPGLATGSHTYNMAGSYTITLTVTGSDRLSGEATTDVTTSLSILVLDPTAGGALSLSGNASINLPGILAVDSTATNAVSASGNSSMSASSIQVVGKVQKIGNATFTPAPTTDASAVSDPLSALAYPSASCLTSYGSENLSGSASATIKPGIYSQISVSGNASLTLCPGVYLIKGGGLSVSGNASIAGSGVMIVNAGSQYPTTGGTYGSISLSGNGSYKLSPQTAGAYAGIVIFQPRDNTKAVTLSGNGAEITGTIYAPAAQLSESGTAQLNASVIVDTMTVIGNGVNNAVALATPSASVAYSPAQIRTAYGINALAMDGTGQTIAIVDAYDDPSIFQSLDAFDNQFGVMSSGPTLYAEYGPASSFLTVLNQYGQGTSLPSTDPTEAGTGNWEVEEALDVEWAHAIAPGAQIVLVEASSQSLSALMASVATAAAQPGVLAVSMSWGFAEGQGVFASDEAKCDKVFDVPGVTFVASTGDYGASDPQYPAFSPNVVAVGGTSLTLNADHSYNNETGWGYYSSSVDASIGSGGGISQFEPEPAYQQSVQSLGMRTTPDVSLVADPNTGAWIADTYNLDPSNPFEVVGGTSVSAPAWAGLLDLVNQGRSASGEPALNSSSPTEVQQALYALPQSDYNVITSGTNGYSAAAGYNLVTGLGTPVANVLVPDLVTYQGPDTAYDGPTVGPSQDANLDASWTGAGESDDVFSVFDLLTVTSAGVNRHVVLRDLANADSSIRRPKVRLLGDSGVLNATIVTRPIHQFSQRSSTLALDQALGVLTDADSQDMLIGDLAFEQISSGAQKPRSR